MDHLIYNESFRIVICKARGCGYTLYKNKINQHVKAMHHYVTPSERESIQKWVNKIDIDGDFELPYFVRAPVQGLKICQGMRCTASPDCYYICLEYGSFKKHCQARHSEGKFLKRGRPKDIRETRQPWRWVQCQRFFPAGPRSSYIEIKSDGEVEAVDRRVTSTWASLFEGARESVGRSEKLLQEKVSSKTPYNAFLSKAGFAKYLEDYNRKEVRALYESPKPIYKTATLIWETTQSLVSFCHNKLKTTGRFLRLEANRTEAGKQPDQALQCYQHERTDVYALPWKQIMMIFYRIKLDEGAEFPACKLNRRQLEAQDAFYHEASKEKTGQPQQAIVGGLPKMSNLELLCLEFCMSLLDQNCSAEYDMPLVGAFAALGLSEKSWKHVGQITSLMSTVVNTSRMMVLQYALHTNEERAAPEGPAEDPINYLKELVEGFLLRGTNSPINWLHDARNLGMEIDRGETSLGELSWSGDRLSYCQIQFTMDEYRGFIQRLLADARELLYEDLLFDAHPDQVPRVRWSELCDDTRNNTPGLNFVDFSSHALEADGDYLSRRVDTSSRLQKQFVKACAGGEASPQRIERWLKLAYKFQMLLLLLTYILGGQPPRGTEILAIRHKNPTDGTRRNIYFLDNMICTVTHYHKGYNKSGVGKIIYRYLPLELAELLVTYLWLVQPFVESIEHMHTPKREKSYLLWPPDINNTAYSTDRITYAMKGQTSKHFGQAFGVRDSRHLNIGISKRHMGPESRFDPDLEGYSDSDGEGAHTRMLAKQAGHSAGTREKRYARLTTELDHSKMSERAKFRAVSNEWHALTGVESDYSKGCYGEGFPSRPLLGQKAQKRLHSRRESTDASALAAYESRVRRLKLSRRANARTQLRKLMGPTAEFRGGQEEVVRAILDGESPVVAVMGTGTGKSLLFMLPASISSAGVSVVVVPLLSLQRDLERRARALDIPCSCWDPASPDSPALLLVTAESVPTQAFQAFLQRTADAGRLDRVVLDECHTILGTITEYRPVLQRMGRHVAAGVQMVLLTATLPPSEEAVVWRRMFFPPKGPPALFRSCTTRANIRYGVQRSDHRLADPGFWDTAVEEINRARVEVETGQLIVYCSSKAITEEAARRLEGAAYHSDVADRDSVARRFLDSARGVVAATSALSLGFDPPSVRCVVHIGPPGNMIEYLQESGRAGRDGRPSRAVLILVEGVHRGGDSAGIESRNVMRAYAQEPAAGGECRRVVIARYVDGTSRGGCLEPEQPCDVCTKSGEPRPTSPAPQPAPREPSPAAPPASADADAVKRLISAYKEPRNTLLASVKWEHETMERIEWCLGWCLDNCPYCAIIRSDHDHCIGQCPNDVNFRGPADVLKSSINFKQFAACYKCGVPFKLCKAWVAKPGTNLPLGARYVHTRNVECQYKGIPFRVVGAGIALKEKPEIKQVLADLKRKGAIKDKEPEHFTLAGCIQNFGIRIGGDDLDVSLIIYTAALVANAAHKSIKGNK